MNLNFLDQLPVAMLQCENTAVVYYNTPAQRLFPELKKLRPQEQYRFLKEKMPEHQGEIELVAGYYSYHFQEKEGESLYSLQPTPLEKLNQNQLARMIQYLRNDLTHISLAVDSLAKESNAVDIKEASKEMAQCSANRALANIYRLLSNCEISVTNNLKCDSYIVDVAGLLREVQQEVNSLFETKQIKFIGSEVSCLVKGNTYYLKKVFFALIANAFRYAEELEIKLHREKKFVLVIFQDNNPNIVERSLPELLLGDPARNSFTPGIGAGLSIVAVQRILKELQYDLWVETPKTGGFCLNISIPFSETEAKEDDGTLAVLEKSDDTSVQADGGFNELLLNFSPILERSFYVAKDLES